MESESDNDIENLKKRLARTEQVSQVYVRSGKMQQRALAELEKTTRMHENLSRMLTASFQKVIDEHEVVIERGDISHEKAVDMLYVERMLQKERQERSNVYMVLHEIKNHLAIMMPIIEMLEVGERMDGEILGMLERASLGMRSILNEVRGRVTSEMISIDPDAMAHAHIKSC